MIQVWLYDKNFYFTGLTDFVEEVKDGMTTVPYLIGYIKGKFNLETQQWEEGATDEEIEAWKQANTSPKVPTLEERIAILEAENASLKEYVKNVEETSKDGILEVTELTLSV